MNTVLELATERVALDRLTPHPDNPRRGDVAAIAESLRVHGQYRPIVVQRSTGHVLAGNHTLRAAADLGWAAIDVVFVDVDDDQARRILLVDNRTGDVAAYDEAELMDLLQGLVVSPEALAGTAWEPGDLVDLANRLSVPDLDSLEERYGEAEEEALWPMVRLRLPPEDYSRFRAVLEAMAGTSDRERFVALVERAAAGLPAA